MVRNGFRRNGGEELEQARKARRILEKVRGRLLRPTVEALDGGAADLSIAVECLQALETHLRLPLPKGTARQALVAEIASLSQELRAVQALAAAAGKFYEGWARLLSASEQSAANYTADGQTASATPIAGKVMMHG